MPRPHFITFFFTGVQSLASIPSRGKSAGSFPEQGVVIELMKSLESLVELRASKRNLNMKFHSFVLTAHGFKLGPVSGKILAQLAMGETPAYDLSPFRISRFKTSIGQKASL